MNENFFISICIPSYNRPNELERLLESIDYSGSEGIEILISEDMSPARESIKEVVGKFSVKSKYTISYYENENNFGYDKNIRECINRAKGKWIIFMGDDDMFVPHQLNDYVAFIKNNDSIAYILRAYRVIHSNGSIENFIYYPEVKHFPSGYNAYMDLFRKSVFISGFTVKRDLANEFYTNQFDGTLLYQLYIQAEVCLNNASACYNIPFTQAIDGGIPYFGNSSSEKDLYVSGSNPVENSITFLKQYFKITQYIDEKYQLNSTQDIKMDMSKYSYGFLVEQSGKGRKEFKRYHKELCKIGFNCTFYYYIYYIILYLFGRGFSDSIIRKLKYVLKKTPQL